MFSSLTIVCVQAVHDMWVACGRSSALTHSHSFRRNQAWKTRAFTHSLYNFSTQAFPTLKSISVSVNLWLYTFYTLLIKTTTNSIKEFV
jgi:hypothetical protein